jgi:glycerophosphoryl diester phosphodiesterase
MHISDSAVTGLTGLDLPPVIGHRGVAGMAPENTLAALRRAHALGCRWVEFDVRLTGDGELILLHDDRLERTTNGCGIARALSLSAIRRFDAGSWFDPAFAGERVPTLAQAIAVLSELELGANVELKPNRGDAIETGTVAADAVTRLWPAHLPAPLISSFVPDAIEAVRQRAPAIARGLLLRSATGKRWRRAEVLGCATVNVDHRRLHPAVVAEIRKAACSVLAYTVNDEMRARELFEWGVSSVFSDVPQMIFPQLPVGPLRPEKPPLLRLSS